MLRQLSVTNVSVLPDIAIEQARKASSIDRLGEVYASPQLKQDRASQLNRELNARVSGQTQDNIKSGLVRTQMVGTVSHETQVLLGADWCGGWWCG